MGHEAPKKFEDYVYVLDYMAHGKMGGIRMAFRSEPLVQIMGENYFTLLEAIPRTGIIISLHERLYIGKDLPREKISHILGRINYDDLSSTAKIELPLAVEDIVIKNEGRFNKFFNNAEAVTPRMHSLELIPGIGKKYTWTILRVREQKLFESFEDIKKRTGLPDPVKLITKRIMEELTEKDPKYRLFTRAP
jgi:putative nucleotide binding protein